MAAGLRCGSTTIKYLLFFFNFLFVICGILLVALGAVGITKTVKGVDAVGSTLIFLIIVGGIIFVVAFMGCCGAVRESNCMLVTFACLLLTIIVCEVVAAIIIFVYIGTVEGAVDQIYKEARDNKDATAIAAIDSFQQSLKCCGLTGPTYWGSQIPNSCCDAQSSCTLSNAYSKGCKTLITDSLKMFGKAIGGVAIAFAVIEVLGVWFALALAGEIKRLER